MADYVYDDLRRMWVDAITGAPLTAETVIEEMRIHQEAARAMLTTLTEQLYAGQISIEQWEIAVASLLKDMHLAQAAHGAGGKDNLDPATVKQVSDTLNKEFTFLQDFALAIVAGLSLAMALSRIMLYANATQQSFWWAFAHSQGKGAKIIWVLGIAEHCNGCINLANNSPYTAETLPTVPGAGHTECKSNCQCGLEVVNAVH